MKSLMKRYLPRAAVFAAVARWRPAPPPAAAAGRSFPPAGSRMAQQVCALRGIQLTITLTAILAVTGCHAVHQDAALIGTQAPDFTLRDAQEEDSTPPVKLSRLVESGPVVIIFHRGLHCPICTRHLLHISERMADFTRAGVQVVAIGPDTPAEARVSLDVTGPIAMPLLSDSGDLTARAFGLESSSHGLQHGTFVVDRSRRIHYAGKADEPVGTARELLNAGRAAARRTDD